VEAATGMPIGDEEEYATSQSAIALLHPHPKLVIPTKANK